MTGTMREFMIQRDVKFIAVGEVHHLRHLHLIPRREITGASAALPNRRWIVHVPNEHFCRIDRCDMLCVYGRHIESINTTYRIGLVIAQQRNPFNLVSLQVFPFEDLPEDVTVQQIWRVTVWLGFDLRYSAPKPSVLLHG